MMWIKVQYLVMVNYKFNFLLIRNLIIFVPKSVFSGRTERLNTNDDVLQSIDDSY